jgi:hypothetical protein
MAREAKNRLNGVPTRRAGQYLLAMTDGRARQTERIKLLRQALLNAGHVSLNQQAAALGLARSTTWAVLQANHKCWGLRAAVVKRMLASPTLPASARDAILSYVDEKLRGAYGHNDLQVDRFSARLSEFEAPLQFRKRS